MPRGRDDGTQSTERVCTEGVSGRVHCCPWGQPSPCSLQGALLRRQAGGTISLLPKSKELKWELACPRLWAVNTLSGQVQPAVAEARRSPQARQPRACRPFRLCLGEEAGLPAGLLLGFINGKVWRLPGARVIRTWDGLLRQRPWATQQVPRGGFLWARDHTSGFGLGGPAAQR